MRGILAYLKVPTDPDGLHHALRIFIGTSILWFLLSYLGDTSALWAVISLIVVTETHLDATWLNFKARMAHTMIGCIIGFTSLVIAGSHAWTLPFALTLAVLISHYITRISLGWRVAPVTTALILSAGLSQKSAIVGLETAAHRTFEVLLGSTMALLMTWIIHIVWKKQTPSEPRAEVGS